MALGRECTGKRALGRALVRLHGAEARESACATTARPKLARRRKNRNEWRTIVHLESVTDTDRR